MLLSIRRFYPYVTLPNLASVYIHFFFLFLVESTLHKNFRSVLVWLGIPENRDPGPYKNRKTGTLAGP